MDNDQKLEIEQYLIKEIFEDVNIFKKNSLKTHFFLNYSEILEKYLDLNVKEMTPQIADKYFKDDFNFIVDLMENDFKIDKISEVIEIQIYIYKEVSTHKLKKNLMNDLITNDEYNQAIKQLEKETNAKDELSYNEHLKEIYLDSFETKKEFLKTSYKCLDEFVKFQKGDITVISGMTSTGKTTFALNLTTEMSYYNNFNGLYFSLEMNASSVMNKIISSIINVYTTNLETRNINEKEMEKVKKVYGNLKNKQTLRIFDERNIDLDYIKKKLNYFAGVDYIVIDLLDKMSLKGSEARWEKLRNAVIEIDEIAKIFNIHVFLIAQLNRQAKSEKITSENIAGSSAIEQTASNILLFKRTRQEKNEEESEEMNDKRNVELVIDKNRSGATAKLKYYFELEYSRIKEIGVKEDETH